MNLNLRIIAFFVAAFGLLHTFSLWAYFDPSLSPIFFLILLGASAFFVFYKPSLAALPLILNLLLDSSGHLFEWHDISLRLSLLALALLGWLYGALKEGSLKQQLKTPFKSGIGLVLLFVLFAVYNGWMQGHQNKSVIADAVPFAYLLSFYPFRSLLKKWKSLPPVASSAIIASFVGAALLSTAMLYLFSSETVLLQEPLYKWFRDVVAGKITSTGNGFYRIVTPLHLLLTALVPAAVYHLLYKSNKLTKRAAYILLLLILVVPAINFSRMYFLALIPATLVFAFYSKIGLKKAVNTLVIIGLSSIAIYTGANLLSSLGQSYGFEFLFGQAQGIVDPQSEASASARGAILPHLIDKIKTRPILGEGLGSTVTYYNPFFEKKLTTPHLDWGYLEIFVEFGLMVGIALLALLFTGAWSVKNSPFAISSLVFLFSVTLTTPALFHVYGVVIISTIFSSKRLDKR